MMTGFAKRYTWRVLRDDAVHVASLDPARNMQLEDVTWAEATVMRPAEGAVEEELVADVEGSPVLPQRAARPDAAMRARGDVLSPIEAPVQ